MPTVVTQFYNMSMVQTLKVVVKKIKFVHSREPGEISVMFRSLLWFFYNECKAQSNCIRNVGSLSRMHYINFYKTRVASEV